MPGKHPKRKLRPGVDDYGRTPLHYAALDGDAAQVQKIVQGGADVNLQDDNGFSPLHFAAQSNAAEVAKVLLNAGANVTLRDAWGNMPLMRAISAFRGEGSVIYLLRAAGSDPNAANDSGVTPVQAARQVANYDIAQFFRDLP